MSEKIYDVPAEWAKRAWIDEAKYRDMYARSVSDPNGFWAEQAKRIDWMKAPYQDREHRRSHRATSRSNGSRTASSTSPITASTAISHKRGDQTAIIWEGDDPSQSKHITYRQLHDEVCKMANILRTRNVKKGDRVTIYLPMIPEAAYAMLACARIGAIHSVVFAGFSPDSLAQRITRLPVQDRHHRRRGPARRQEGAAEGQCRCRAGQGRRRRLGRRGQAHRRQGRHESVARSLVPRRRADGDDRMPVRAHARGRSAVHSLYVGLDRPAQGRAAHLGRLSRVRVDDASICVRLSRRRHLLVHRRRRLGHRPQLHSLWAARQRRDHADVRGRAELSGQFAVLERHRQAQGQHLLHRADRDPRADAVRRRAGEEDLARSRCGCSARSASRSIRKPGSGITAWSATIAARSSIPGGRPRPAAS